MSNITLWRLTYKLHSLHNVFVVVSKVADFIGWSMFWQGKKYKPSQAGKGITDQMARRPQIRPQNNNSKGKNFYSRKVNQSMVKKAKYIAIGN